MGTSIEERRMTKDRRGIYPSEAYAFLSCTENREAGFYSRQIAPVLAFAKENQTAIAVECFDRWSMPAIL